MGWLDKKSVPKELEGLSEEQIVTRLKESGELKAQLDAAQGKVTELSTKFETFNSEFETKVATAVTEAIGKLAPRGDNNQEKREAKLTAWLDDPEKALNERLTPIAGVVLQQGAVAGKNAARELFQRRQRNGGGKNFDGFFFDKYEAEIEQLAKNVPAANLSQVETWEHLFYNIKGRHADEIAAQMKDGTFEGSIESGSAGSRQRESQADNDTKATPLEEKIAGKLGQTPEQYMKMKKGIISNPLGVNV
jgi:hypothetical protein